MTQSDATTGLSSRLRTATQDAHRQAETRPLVRDLLSGRLERGGYVLLLRALREIYASLEGGFDTAQARDLDIARFAAPELRRTPALEADLEFLHGADWRQAVTVAEAAEGYAAHLKDIAERDPVLLVAHAYVRYLGDLSGGRAMGRQVAKHYDLSGEAGVRFYRFPEIDDVDVWKTLYRGALDALSTRGRDDDLVTEAREAFAWNQRIFDDVQALR